MYDLGFVPGCLPIDRLRQSTLECLFDEICLNELNTLINFSMSILPLDSSRSTRFSPNMTLIGSIIDERFVDSWENSSNYSKYFAACAPSICS